MTEQTSTFPASQKYFGAAASEYDQRRQSMAPFHKDQFVITTTLSAYVKPGSKVLDIACGTNRVSPTVRELGGLYHGIDASSDMIALAKEKDPQSELQVADARHIPYPPNHFDLVLTIKFLKWVPNDQALDVILREIVRVLRPGGIAILHQKISAHPQRKKPNIVTDFLRKTLARMKGKDAARTRTVDENRFLDLCRRANLVFRYAALTSGIIDSSSDMSTNAFYILEKSSE